MTLYDYYEESIRAVRSDISSKDEQYILGADTDKLVEYYVAKYALPLIEKHPDLSPIIEKVKSQSGGWSTYVPFIIRYPIISRERIHESIRRRASTYNLGAPDLVIESGYIVVKDSFHSEGDGSQKISSVLEYIANNIGWRNSDIKAGNERIRSIAKQYIESIKEKYARENEVFQNSVSKVPVKLEIKKSGPLPIINLDVKESVKAVLPEAHKPEELVLAPEKVRKLVNYVRNAALSFETTPKVYSRFEEEDLRDNILGILNAIYEGEAIGETFSRRGKTDIYLKIRKGDILVMECKIWKGKEEFEKAIGQLFSYLTWRHNYGIIIIFNKKNKDFREVVIKAKEYTKSHPSFIQNSLKEENETHFITQHTHPTDSGKRIELHNLLFHLFYE